MCSIAVLRDDLISSSLSMRSWCRCLRTIYLLAQCLALIHPQSASTALRRQFIKWDKSPRQLSISSVVSLRASETFTWSRATCRSSVIRRTPSQTFFSTRSAESHRSCQHKKKESLSMSHEGAQRAVGRTPGASGPASTSRSNERAKKHQ